MRAAAKQAYLAADLIGSSLIMQQDQFRDLDLFSLFRNLLVPEITKYGGQGVEFTGDEVTARCPESHSATRAGFAIHRALTTYNSSLSGPKLAVRIGIYSDSPAAEDSRHEFLPRSYASFLQSIGRPDVLCISSAVQSEIKPGSASYAQLLAAHEAGFIPANDSVFYLFASRPGVWVRLRLQIGLMKRQAYEHVKLSGLTIALFTIAIASAAYLSSSTHEMRVKHLELMPVIDFSADNHHAEISRFNGLLREGLSGVPGIKISRDNESMNSDLRLVCSFQQIANRLRLNWGLYQIHDGVQTAGGVLTGKLNNSRGLEEQLLQNVIAHLEYH